MSNESSANRLWQKKLLPFMIVTLIVLTVFFIGASYVEFLDFKNRLDATTKNREEILQVMSASGDSLVPDEQIVRDNRQNGFEYVKWRTSVLLERETLNRRYNHSLAIIFSRMWTSYLGFLTGMILAVVGAVFILGKLSEEMTEFGGETSAIKVSLKSASPGIILAVLGTILLLTTLALKIDVYVNDGNLYLNTQSNTPIQAKPVDINIGDTRLSNANQAPPQNDKSFQPEREKEVDRQQRELDRLKQENTSR